MPVQPIAVRTRDGACPTHILAPDGAGPWPAVILYMDAGGIRPALVEMARRLAAGGYLVVLPDLFYRYGPYGPFVPAEVFKGDFRRILGPLMATTDAIKAADDTGALLAHLDTRGDVAGRRIGAVGFCMGGRMALTAAGTYADRFAAVASFHGGHLATEEPTSPHRMARRLEAEVYIAAAQNDGSYPPAMAERLEAALARASVRYRAETYPAAHGWMMPDFPVHDRAAAERGWEAMRALFDRTLRGAG
jgi:carboxymethylenebutenolidase